jgi:hypothetical protein
MCDSETWFRDNEVLIRIHTVTVITARPGYKDRLSNTRWRYALPPPWHLFQDNLKSPRVKRQRFPWQLVSLTVDDERSFSIPATLTWVRRFWCDNAVCTKHVLTVARLSHNVIQLAYRLKCPRSVYKVSLPLGSRWQNFDRNLDRIDENYYRRW